eukprot:scaffold5006_cov116-Isochrysis_galbana.AAC.12
MRHAGRSGAQAGHVRRKRPHVLGIDAPRPARRFSQLGLDADPARSQQRQVLLVHLAAARLRHQADDLCRAEIAPAHLLIEQDPRAALQRVDGRCPRQKATGECGHGAMRLCRRRGCDRGDHLRQLRRGRRRFAAGRPLCQQSEAPDLGHRAAGQSDSVHCRDLCQLGGALGAIRLVLAPRARERCAEHRALHRCRGQWRRAFPHCQRRWSRLINGLAEHNKCHAGWPGRTQRGRQRRPARLHRQRRGGAHPATCRAYRGCAVTAISKGKGGCRVGERHRVVVAPGTAQQRGQRDELTQRNRLWCRGDLVRRVGRERRAGGQQQAHDSLVGGAVPAAVLGLRRGTCTGHNHVERTPPVLVAGVH